MQVNRQQCQACGAHEHNNLLQRIERQPITVFVRCARCGELVARYQLSDYYHHGKGIDSWLQCRDTGSRESGRDMIAQFDRVKQEAQEGYEAVLEELSRLGKGF